MTSLAKRAVHAKTRAIAEKLATDEGLTEPTKEIWLRAQEITKAEYDATD